MNAYREITHNGLWKQNAILAQVLGLCPTLAVSTTLTNSVSLGLATALVMALSSLAVSALRAFIPYEVRIPVFILIIATLVTMVDLAFNAWLHELYVILGIFIPLIVTNCIVLARVEAFAAKNPAWHSAWDGFVMGIGLTAVLAVLGAVREFIGQGTVLAGIAMIIPGAEAIQVLPEDYPGFLISILPPGAFIFLGLMIAVRNWMDARANARAAEQARRQQLQAQASSA
ncbi:electron transport complex subunit RsxE [Denitratisoma oestradiolicum]|uniref:Ion-translocating oxidoreductase complex subunit E n=1 Tax=Denitratisoma oestradiolicum TaxID=311182 RepID=A0A6S6XX41_9PROT|nr:electron transport complex subunit E [Denitratisoma oestradiolicum]TWO81950.1 electron transport complex subunit RsxE [Denitratisoma oestradiolicum]CAB1368853.1 putative inner membrane NADH-quinone reductase [Denitratisoma oestradiolicum]